MPDGRRKETNPEWFEVGAGTGQINGNFVSLIEQMGVTPDAKGRYHVIALQMLLKALLDESSPHNKSSEISGADHLTEYLRTLFLETYGETVGQEGMPLVEQLGLTVDNLKGQPIGKHGSNFRYTLSQYAFNRLMNSGKFNTPAGARFIMAERLAAMSEDELRSIRDVGGKVVSQVKELLKTINADAEK